VSTRLSPNGEHGHFDVVFSFLLKICAALTVALLTAATLGLFALYIQVQILTESIKAIHIDLVKVQVDVKDTSDKFSDHLLEVEKIKAAYVTKDQWEKGRRK